MPPHSFALEVMKIFIHTLIASILLFIALDPAIAQETCPKDLESFFLYDTITQAKDAGIDYEKNLRKALEKDKNALRTLFQVTTAGTLDGVLNH